MQIVRAGGCQVKVGFFNSKCKISIIIYKNGNYFFNYKTIKFLSYSIIIKYRKW